MSKLSERQRLILTIAVTVLITGGLLALIVKDRGEIEATTEEIATLDSRIQAAEMEIQKTKDREDRVLVYRAVEDRELEVLPTKQEIAGFHRDLSTFLTQAGLAFQELPESTPMESDLAKGIYVTRTVLSCEGTSAALLKFLNMIENDDRLVAIKGLKVRAGQKDRNNPRKPISHDIEVHLETYFYNPQSRTLQRNNIPGEDARLQDEEIQDAISAFQPERPDTYVLRPATSRRDSLIDPRAARPSLDPEELERQWTMQEGVVAEFEKSVDDIHEKVEQENALLISGDLFRRDRVAREIEGLLNRTLAQLAHVDQMKKVVIPDLVVRLEDARSRLDDLKSRRPPVELRVTRAVAEKTLAEVHEAFDTAQYAEVSTLTAQWVLYLEGKEIEPDARTAVQAISDLRPRAKVYAEFQAMIPRVTGTIVHPLDPQRSVALVNGRPCHPGDAVDTNGEIVVGRIARQGVEFIYKEEAILVPRRSGGIIKPGASSMEGVHATMAPAGAGD